MSSVKKNFLYNVAYQLLAIAIPLITMPYLSRVLGATGIGEYSYTYGIAECFGFFTLLGVNNYGNRTIARSRTSGGDVPRAFWEIYAFQILAGLIVVAAYLVYLLFACSADMLISAIWLVYLASVAFDINWFFFGMERFKTTVIRNTAVKLLTFASIFIFVHDSADVWKYCLILAVGALISQVVLWPFLIKSIGWQKPTLSGIAKHVKPNLILFIPVIAVSLYQVADRVILGLMAGYYEAGLFENALRVTVIPFAVVTALGTVMLPRITNLIASNQIEKCKTYLSDSFWLTAIISSIIMFGIASISFELAPVYFGEEFSFCSWLILIMIFDIPFRTWGNVIRTQYLMPLGKDKIFVSSVVAGAVVNLVINVLLIPVLGSLGAAIATFITEATVCVYQVFAVRNELPLRSYFVVGLPFYGIGLVMFIGVRLFSGFVGVSVAGLVLEILIGAAIFAVGCVGYYVVTRDERVDSMLIAPLLKKLGK